MLDLTPAITPGAARAPMRVSVPYLCCALNLCTVFQARLPTSKPRPLHPFRIRYHRVLRITLTLQLDQPQSLRI